MRHKKLLWCAVLWLCFGLSTLQAQNTMFINEKSGPLTFCSVNCINKLTFTSGNLAVNKKDGSMSTYALTNIRSLYFRNTVTSVEITGKDNRSIMLFPNPVINELHIRYESKTTGNVDIQIMDIQGKIINQQTRNTHSGTNYISIPSEKLLRGLYLFRLQQGNTIETSLFSK